jgi:hypothetical protein
MQAAGLSPPHAPQHRREDNSAHGNPRRSIVMAMIKFLAGLVLGLVLGSAVAALAAEVLGDGTLEGWLVIRDGKQVCRDPEVDNRAKILECD